MRLSFMPSTSCTMGLYVQPCARPAARSKLRSNRHSSGRDSDALRPSTPSLNRLERALSASLSRWSSMPATCSAAPPRGHRMMGTTPIVTHTLNRPSTMLLTMASICASAAAGSFSCTYASANPRENMLGSRAMNDTYWSKILLTLLTALDLTAPEASCSNSLEGKLDVKLRCMLSYSEPAASAMIRSMLLVLGCTRYTAGTSGMGWRSASSMRCSVTPFRRRSFSRSRGAIMSLLYRSSTSTLYSSPGSLPGPDGLFRFRTLSSTSDCFCLMLNTMAQLE
mmetsp:Transcript_34613/g.87572  ORF Transcript_34613/g.87572 Transcript_34613/m.87572 type:complete len:281 (-) Transcript_34613:84-926(-)